MILVTGAGGKTGRALIKALSMIESVFAFVHREEHVSILGSLGAEKVNCHSLSDGWGECDLSHLPKYEPR